MQNLWAMNPFSQDSANLVLLGHIQKSTYSPGAWAIYLGRQFALHAYQSPHSWTTEVFW